MPFMQHCRRHSDNVDTVHLDFGTTSTVDPIAVPEIEVAGRDALIIHVEYQLRLGCSRERIRRATGGFVSNFRGTRNLTRSSRILCLAALWSPSSASFTWVAVAGTELSFPETIELFRYIDTHRTLSSKNDLDEIE